MRRLYQVGITQQHDFKSSSSRHCHLEDDNDRLAHINTSTSIGYDDYAAADAYDDDSVDDNEDDDDDETNNSNDDHCFFSSCVGKQS